MTIFLIVNSNFTLFVIFKKLQYTNIAYLHCAERL